MKSMLVYALPLLAVAAGSGDAVADSQPTTAAPDASPRMVGAYTPVSTENPDVVEAAEFAVESINDRSNSVEPYTLKKILSARSQVVAGMNYALALELARGQTTEIHDVVVFSQPWTNTTTLTSDTIRR